MEIIKFCTRHEERAARMQRNKIAQYGGNDHYYPHTPVLLQRVAKTNCQFCLPSRYHGG